MFNNDINTVLEQADLFLSKLSDDTKACRIVDSEDGVGKLKQNIDSFFKWPKTGRCNSMWASAKLCTMADQIPELVRHGWC